ncbi:MAG: flagellar biosynthesis protein FlhB [Cyanobacteria bacterium HKST-UBA04]|nr:flagellar biosynthesis protein FlhB [Cyanobacteria bacterium HKST-UBA04]
MGDEDKQFEATPQKIKKAREQGQVIKSKDISTAIFLIVMFMFLYYMFPFIWKQLLRMFVLLYDEIPLISVENIGEMYVMTIVIITLVSVIGPMLLLALIVAVIGDFFQVGPLLAVKAIEPKFDKLNPVKGLKNLITMKSLFELVKNIIKISILGMLGFMSIWDHRREVLVIGLTENLFAMTTLLGEILFAFMIKAMVVFFIIAAMDYLFQRWKFLKDQKMSFKELKDEFKNTEGDPHVKAQLRQKRMQMLQQSMLEAVPLSDVVITNPIHIACAVQYTHEEMEAPKLVAKGTELFAEKIKEIARDHGIPIVENEAVARTLFRTVDIDQEIPPELYQAVAEILMFAWKITGQSVPGQGSPETTQNATES